MKKTELTQIPGVGPKMAQHLINAGFPSITSLKTATAEQIYAADCQYQGERVDPCALYTYRLAVHWAKHDGQLPEGKENWWNWKN